MFQEIRGVHELMLEGVISVGVLKLDRLSLIE